MGVLMKKARYPKRKPLVKQVYKGVRHTHSTIAGVEDTVAVLIDMLYSIKRLLTYYDAFGQDLNKINERAEKAMHQLYVLRKGPFAYPLEDDIVVIKTKKDGRTLQITPSKEKGNSHGSE